MTTTARGFPSGRAERRKILRPPFPANVSSRTVSAIVVSDVEGSKTQGYQIQTFVPVTVPIDRSWASCSTRRPLVEWRQRFRRVAVLPVLPEQTAHDVEHWDDEATHERRHFEHRK